MFFVFSNYGSDILLPFNGCLLKPDLAHILGPVGYPEDMQGQSWCLTVQIPPRDHLVEHSSSVHRVLFLGCLHCTEQLAAKRPRRQKRNQRKKRIKQTGEVSQFNRLIWAAAECFSRAMDRSGARQINNQKQHKERRHPQGTIMTVPGRYGLVV